MNRRTALRGALVLASLALSAAAARPLLRDTRTAARSGEPVTRLLARHAPAGGGVVILFQPEDCMGDGAIVRRWNALANAPGLRVHGLAIGTGRISPAQKQVFAHTGLTMPLGAIPVLDAELVAGALGYSQTPFAVVLDRRGRIAGSFPAGQNVAPEVMAKLISGS